MMPRRSLTAFSAFISVLGTVTAFGHSATTAHQPQPITDSESYAIYAVLVPVWARQPEKGILLQQETDPKPWCSSSRALPTAEWQSVKAEYLKQNKQIRSLMAALPLTVPYRFVRRSDIEAHDARLALKYPGQMQRRPGSMEYVVVSAVGFNAAKTKAMVHVRTPNHGGTFTMELREGQWVEVSVGGCRFAV